MPTTVPNISSRLIPWEALVAFRAPNVFNPWAEEDPLDLSCEGLFEASSPVALPGPTGRRARLAAHFAGDIRLILAGEARGIRAAISLVRRSPTRDCCSRAAYHASSSMGGLRVARSPGRSPRLRSYGVRFTNTAWQTVRHSGTHSPGIRTSPGSPIPTAHLRSPNCKRVERCWLQCSTPLPRREWLQLERWPHVF